MNDFKQRPGLFQLEVPYYIISMAMQQTVKQDISNEGARELYRDRNRQQTYFIKNLIESCQIGLSNLLKTNLEVVLNDLCIGHLMRGILSVTDCREWADFLYEPFETFGIVVASVVGRQRQSFERFR